MIELKKCCKVPFPEKLFEKYEVQENAIYANVNASKIIDMMKRFAQMHDEPMFFILEIPCKEEDAITESKTLVNANDDYDVYFIDGLDKEHINQCLDALGDFLTKDGMNTFGVGGHESHEEILFGKYNVMTIYTKSADEYRELLSSFEIEKTESLVTAWDTFDESHPGECSLYVSGETGKTIYDIPDAYKEYGMYLYEARKAYNEAFKQYLKGSYDKMCKVCQERYEKNPLRLLDCKVPECNEIYAKPEIQTVIQSDFICEDCSNHFEELKGYLNELGVNYSINKLLVRGLDYYNRTVFEIKSNNLGSQNAVCGGGRYDSLVKNLGGEETPAIGFAMGMERLASLLGEKQGDKL